MKDKKAKKQKLRKLKQKKLKHQNKTKLLPVTFGFCSEPKFADAVKDILQTFAQSPTRCISKFNVQVLRSLTNHKNLSHDPIVLEKRWSSCVADALKELRDFVFESLPTDIVEKYCPDHIYYIIVSKDQTHFEVSFTQIIHEHTKIGAVHFSSKMPKVVVKRIPAKITFTTHAFERIIERCLPQQNTYNGIATIHSLFGGELFFKATDDGKMLQIYFLSRPKDVGVKKLSSYKVFGKKVNQKQAVYVLVGYCPLNFQVHKDGTSSWVAKTLLILGMNKTPEGDLVRKLPKKLRELVFEQLESIIATRNVCMLWWFQYNGFPCLYVRRRGNLLSLQLDWSQMAGLEDCKTPGESLKYFLKKNLQNLSEKDTILLL